MRLCAVYVIGHTCLGSNHEGSIAIIVLVVDVYEWTHVQQGDNVNETLAHSHHQSILRGNKVEKKRSLSNSMFTFILSLFCCRYIDL